jgi:hypothetical protein
MRPILALLVLLALGACAIGLPDRAPEPAGTTEAAAAG